MIFNCFSLGAGYYDVFDLMSSSCILNGFKARTEKVKVNISRWTVCVTDENKRNDFWLPWIKFALQTNGILIRK